MIKYRGNESIRLFRLIDPQTYDMLIGLEQDLQNVVDRNDSAYTAMIERLSEFHRDFSIFDIMVLQ
jgi:hypothetical protein